MPKNLVYGQKQTMFSGHVCGCNLVHRTLSTLPSEKQEFRRSMCKSTTYWLR